MEHIDEQKCILFDNHQFIKTENDIQEETIGTVFTPEINIKIESSDDNLLDHTIQTEDTCGTGNLQVSDSEIDIYIEKNMQIVEEVFEERFNQNEEANCIEMKRHNDWHIKREDCDGLNNLTCISVETVYVVEKPEHLDGVDDQKVKSTNKETSEDQNASYTVTKLKPFKCEFCNKRCVRKSMLKKHMRAHIAEKPYKCEVCSKSFCQSGYLTSHLRTHTGEKPYQCEVCNKCFAIKCNLKNHMRIHTGEKPYKCEVCNKCFSQSNDTKRHMRTHTWEKPYICEVCCKAFSQNSDLIIHRRTHTGEKPYKCEVCSRPFTRNNDLRRHMKVHSAEKPHKCEVCNKRFSQSSHVIRHMRSHTGEKPYQCEICNKSFSHDNNMRRHKRTHSKVLEKKIKNELNCF